MEPARLAEAHRAAQHGGARQVQLPRLEHDDFVEGLVMPAVGFANEDAKQDGIVGYFHGQAPLRWLMEAATR